MGKKNAPTIHQHCVTCALRPWIRQICHIYMDYIAIWSQTVKEHTTNVMTILQALLDHKLYLNLKKSKLFCSEICFLEHCILAKGIKADEGKADCIKKWPTPSCAKHVHSFLGLVCYLAAFLPNLAQHTNVLDKLTTKECDKVFLPWSEHHQKAFDNIKELVLSKACLTTINPLLKPLYKIFVTMDASDTGSGAVLSFSPSYKMARPMAYDSCAFKGAELNYPIHKKELLTIIQALAKWHTDLLGYKFKVWTDHQSLEHFGTQHNLSCQQACWMEFMSHYNAMIHYIPGEKNCTADALSRLSDPPLHTIASMMNASQPNKIWSCFELEDIKNGYNTDLFTEKLTSAMTGMSNIQQANGFWLVNNRLLIPNAHSLCETLYWITHDKMGHFSMQKTYKTLCALFYWPNMQRDLKSAYIPLCTECQ